MVNQHLSYNLCSHVSELFSAMFPDSEVAQKFSMRKTKSRYMTIYGLAPYFKKELLKKINSSLFYSVSFDESFNSELQKCQMDINVLYWDTKKNIAVTRYFDSAFLDRSNASNLLDSLQESTKPLLGEKFLQLAMDGPNVNWNVLDGLDEQLIKNGHTKTINIGSCAQHIVHGAHQNGFCKIDWNIDKVLKSMYLLLNDSPARGSIYREVGNTDKFPLR